MRYQYGDKNEMSISSNDWQLTLFICWRHYPNKKAIDIGTIHHYVSTMSIKLFWYTSISLASITPGKIEEEWHATMDMELYFPSITIMVFYVDVISTTSWAYWLESQCYSHRKLSPSWKDLLFIQLWFYSIIPALATGTIF